MTMKFICILLAVICITLAFLKSGFSNRRKFSQSAESNNRSIVSYEDSKQNLSRSYISMHSIQSILQEDDICSRRFIVTQQSCGNFGNNFGNFLLNAIMAVILNRTLLVDYSASKWPCAEHWRPHSWVPYLGLNSSIQEVAIAKNCTISSQSLAVSVTRGYELKCCEIESSFSDITSIHFNGYFNTIAYSSYQPLSGAVLSPVAQQRAMALLHTPNFQFSKYSSLGFITDMFLSFQQPVIDAVSPIISELGGDPIFNPGLPITAVSGIPDRSSNGMNYRRSVSSLVIGLHIRHQLLGKESEWDNASLVCLAATLKAIAASDSVPTDGYIENTRKCFILLATDRVKTVELISEFGMQRGCKVMTVVNRNSTYGGMEANHVYGSLSTTKPIGEHGPWTDNLSKSADIHLLSHADVFIGTAGSTFSSLIGNLVALRALKQILAGRRYINYPPVMLIRAGKHADTNLLRRSSSNNSSSSNSIHMQCSIDVDRPVDLRKSCVGKQMHFNSSIRSCS